MTPFNLFAGLALIAGYALLGATWLIMKTVGDLQRWSYRVARRMLLLVLLGVAGVSLWTPLAEPAIAKRWFSLPNFYSLSQVPFATFLLSAACWRVLVREKTSQQRYAFYLSIGLFLLAYLGLCISVWPYLVPRTLSIWEAAAAPSTQLFALIGFLALLPFVVGYTLLSYGVFKGKVTAGERYY